MKIINESGFVRFRYWPGEGAPVLSYDCHPFRCGVFANGDISVENAKEIVRANWIDQDFVEHFHVRYFLEASRGTFQDVFRHLACPKRVEHERLTKQHVWKNKWDERNAENVLAWIEAGGDIDTPSRGHPYTDGMTLYFLAAYFGSPKLKQLLIARGADPNAYSRPQLAQAADSDSSLQDR